MSYGMWFLCALRCSLHATKLGVNAAIMLNNASLKHLQNLQIAAERQHLPSHTCSAGCEHISHPKAFYHQWLCSQLCSRRRQVVSHKHLPVRATLIKTLYFHKIPEYGVWNLYVGSIFSLRYRLRVHISPSKGLSEFLPAQTTFGGGKQRLSSPPPSTCKFQEPKRMLIFLLSL